MQARSLITLCAMLWVSPTRAADTLPVSVGAVDARVLSIDRLHVDRIGRSDFSVQYDVASPHLQDESGAHLLNEQVRVMAGTGMHLGSGWYSTLQIPMLLRQTGFDPTTGRPLRGTGIENVVLGLRSALITARYLRVGMGANANISTGAQLDPYGGTQETTLSPWASLHTGIGRIDSGIALALLPRSTGDAARSTIDARLNVSEDVAFVGEFATEHTLVDAHTAWGALAGTVIQLGAEVQMRTLFGRDIHYAPNGTRVLATLNYYPRPKRLALPAKDAPRPSIADFERWEKYLAAEEAEPLEQVSPPPPPAPIAATITNEAAPPPPGEGWGVVSGKTQSTEDAVAKGWVEILTTGSGISFDRERLDISSDPAIQTLAETLRTRPEIHVRIEVNVKTTGEVTADFKLSQSRADHLRDLLLTYGIEGKRVDAVGFGSGIKDADDLRVVVIE